MRDCLAAGAPRVPVCVRSLRSPVVHICQKYLHSDMTLSGFRFRNIPVARESEGPRQTTLIVTWGTSVLKNLKGQESRSIVHQGAALLGCLISRDYHSSLAAGSERGQTLEVRVLILLHPGHGVYGSRG